jgi:protein SCO1/2
MPRAVVGRRVLLRAGVLAAATGIALWGSGRSEHTYAYTGTPMAPQPAPQLALADDAGGNFDLSQHRGDVVLVYFGYTHCPDVCPTTLTMMAAALTRLGTDARRVQSVFVTLDPRRDTASELREYLANFTTNSAPTPIGLTGSAEAIAAAARDWGVTWRPAESGAFIDHTSVVTAVGPDGRLRLRYSVSQIGDTAAVARDLAHLLHDA